MGAVRELVDTARATVSTEAIECRWCEAFFTGHDRRALYAEHRRALHPIPPDGWVAKPMPQIEGGEPDQSRVRERQRLRERLYPDGPMCETCGDGPFKNAMGVRKHEEKQHRARRA